MKVEKNRKAATVWRDESSSIGSKGGGKAKWMDLGLMLKVESVRTSYVLTI